MKVLKVYYKGTCQEMSVSNGTSEEAIFKTMKRIFRIKEEIDQFFFQDSEGRILILPQDIPTELSLFLYVRDDFNKDDTIPQPSSSLKWKFICSKGIESQLKNDIHLYPFNSPDKNTYPSVISSINFSQGKHFTIIKVDSHGCGCLGIGIPGFPPEYYNYGYLRKNNTQEAEFVFIREYDTNQLTKMTGIAIDCDSKICYFVDVDPNSFQPLNIIEKVTDIPNSILIFASIKSWYCIFSGPYTGITLVKDSLTFPDLSKLTPQKTVCWTTSKVSQF